MVYDFLPVGPLGAVNVCISLVFFSRPSLASSLLLGDGKKQMNECFASHSIQFEYGSIINEEKITRK